jgi:hypothetical protein
MKPGSRNRSTISEAKRALRRILGDFFADRSVAEPYWYRLISARDKHIPYTEKPAHIPALSHVFGMNDKLSDELLLACGLLYYHGEELRFFEARAFWSTSNINLVGMSSDVLLAPTGSSITPTRVSVAKTKGVANRATVLLVLVLMLIAHCSLFIALSLLLAGLSTA